MKSYLFLLSIILLSTYIFAQNNPVRSKRLYPPDTDHYKAYTVKSGSWEKLYPRIPDQNYTAVWFIDSTTGYLAGDYGRIVKTTDGGMNWNIASEGGQRSYNRLSSNDKGENIIAVGTGGLITVSRDRGSSWQPVEVTTNDLWSIDYNGSELWVSGLGNTLLKSPDNGKTWDTVNTGYNRSNWEINFYGKQLGAIACDSGYLLITKDGGKNWTSIKTPEQKSIYAVKFLSSSKMVIGTETLNFYYSNDTGNTWQKASYPQYGGVWVEDIQFRDSLFGYAVLNSVVLHYETTDGGLSWQMQYPARGNQTVQFVDTNLAYNVGYDLEIWKSTNGGREWDQLLRNAPLNDIHIYGDGHAILSSEATFQVYNGLWRTDDDFKKINKYLNYDQCYLIEFISPDTGFVFNGGLIRTTNRGNSWSVVDTSIMFPRKLKFINKSIGYYMDNHHLKKTVNGGSNWVDIPVIYYGTSLTSFDFIDENNGFYITDSAYKTIDGGNCWVVNKPGFHDIGLSDIKIVDMNNIWITGLLCSYRSLDSGKTWNKKEDIKGVQILFLNKSTGFMLNSNGTLLQTTNAGDTWVPDNEVSGLSIKKIRYYKNPDNTADLYIVGKHGLVLRKHTNIVMDVKDNKTLQSPPAYLLCRNYPNPFNPVTSISYTLPNATAVKLTVFNAIGQEVKVLVNSVQGAGEHMANFDAKNLPSGIYIYTLSTEYGTISKKMMLLK